MPRSFQELKYALRTLLKRPTFSLITIFVLALGIGANTAIFSVVNAVLLRPLPFDQPDRLVQIWHVPPAKSFPGMKKFAVSPANFLDWKRQDSSIEAMAAYHGGVFTLTGSGEPQRVPGPEVGPEFFQVLKAKPLMGRTFTDDDGKSEAQHVVVISEGFWRTNLGGNPNVLGQTLRLNEQQYTIIGVMPNSFGYPMYTPAPQVWACLQWDAKERAVRGNHNYVAFGRLKPGVSLQQAQSELSTIASRLEKEYPADDAGWGALIVPLRDELVGDVRPALLILLGAVAFVLLIACANVANLVLAMTLARRKELAIRTALGAKRSQLIGQVLTETVFLAIAGGALGLIFAKGGVHLIVNFLSDEMPRVGDMGLDGPVLVFTLGVSLLTGLLAGIVPAWRYAKADVNEALKQGLGRGGADCGGKGTRTVLVIAEVALSLMLLVGAGLLIRTFYHLQSIDPGFDSHNVLTSSVRLPKTKYEKKDQQRAFHQQALDRSRVLPGAESVATIDSLPLQGGSTQPIMIEGRPVVQMADQPEVPVREVSPDYFKTMHIPVLRGRGIAVSDTAASTPVIVISQSIAKEFFANEDPIGKHMSLELTDKYLEIPTTQREIVGIVGDVKIEGLDSDRSMAAVYQPYEQVPSRYMTLTMRTGNNPVSAIAALTAAIHSIDPSQTLTDTMTMDEVVATSLAQRRFTMMLLVAFSGLALVLAAVGIYSVLSYAVRRRVKEIGIRMALGAQVRDVVQMVVSDGMKPALVGVVIGFAGALGLGQLLASIVYGVSSRDALTLASVSVLLLTVALLASIVPAYRAAQVEPIRTLRDE
jgi:putative ABC transport system permease protein